jgi:hypothetical protein
MKLVEEARNEYEEREEEERATPRVTIFTTASLNPRLPRILFL